MCFSVHFDSKSGIKFSFGFKSALNETNVQVSFGDVCVTQNHSDDVFIDAPLLRHGLRNSETHWAK